MMASQTEQWLRERIAQVLNQPADRISTQVAFTELGLDSLTLFTLTGELAEYLGFDLPSTLVWQHPTIAALAEHLSTCQALQAATTAAVEAPEVWRPLSYGQEHIWRYSRAAGLRLFYQVIRPFLVTGPLDLAAVQSALDEMVHRHEHLRTTFAEVAGEPRQRIHPPAPAFLQVVNLTAEPQPEQAALKRIHALTYELLDLEQLPLLRTYVLRLGPTRQALLFKLHHVLYDARSFSVFYREFSQLYAAFQQGEPSPLPQLSVQMADFATWERRRLHPAGEVYQAEVRWWLDYWEPALPPEPRFHFLRSVPCTTAEPAAGRIDVLLPAGLHRQVEEASRRQGTTAYVLYFAALAATLRQYGAPAELLLGTYVTNRSARGADVLIGYFINQVTFRLVLESLSTWREMVLRLRQAVEEVNAHLELPRLPLEEAFQRIARPLPKPNAIFHYLLSTNPLAIAGAQTEFWAQAVHTPSMPQGLLFNVTRRGEAVTASASFNAVIYDPEGMRNCLADFLVNVEAITRNLEGKLPAQPRAQPWWQRWWQRQRIG